MKKEQSGLSKYMEHCEICLTLPSGNCLYVTKKSFRINVLDQQGKCEVAIYEEGTKLTRLRTCDTEKDCQTVLRNLLFAMDKAIFEGRRVINLPPNPEGT